MNFFFLNDLNFLRKDAGFKARKDALDIAQEHDEVKVINIPLWGGVSSRFLSIIKFSAFLTRLNKRDVLFFNFPMAKPFWHILNIYHRVKQFKIVPLIHDIDTLRGGHGKDPYRLAKCDMVISHNSKMTTYLLKFMPQSKICNIHIFDYLVSDSEQERDISNNGRGVIYAGNLARHKSAFIYHSDCDLYLFGVNYENEANPKYLGSFDAQSPEKIRLNGMQFGLIWDGDSVDTCGGDFGNYLKYNNPHKASLYLSMNLPVFIWDKAALSDFIVKNGLGYAVGSIREMNDILSSITKEKYFELSNNTNAVAQKLRTGYYFRSALDEVICAFKNN